MSLNLSGTNPGEPSTGPRPPSCTAPQQPTIYDEMNELYLHLKYFKKLNTEEKLTVYLFL